MEETIKIESTELQQVITPDQAWHYRIIPRLAEGNKYEFYIDENNFSESVKDELEMLLARQVEFVMSPTETIQNNLSRYYRKNNQHAGKKTLSGTSEDFLTALIYEAKMLGSSDIHIETYEDRCRIRLRIDGRLIEKFVVRKNEYPSLINKIKIKANLDIAEKRLPQDGRIIFSEGDMKFDIRVSALPTLYGEKIVMRLLNKDAGNIDIARLGFDKKQLNDYLEGVKKPHGIILISGPTGSGKTTTLYATLKLLNKDFSNILTIEDPIEYTLEGINQVQLKEDIGLTFARALRTFLRQDPDIIMLGEIRDNETAQMAIRAALTGHLVLSTIHTNSAWGTITRLADMDVPLHFITGTLNLSVAQRLIRKLCPMCREKKPLDETQYPHHFKPYRKLENHYVSVGCEECHFTGYKGRKAVYEVIPIDYELSDAIRNQSSGVSAMLKSKNVSTLAGSAFESFALGETSLEEIYPILMNAYHE